MKQESHFTRATANSRTFSRTSWSGSWPPEAMLLPRSWSRSTSASCVAVVVSIYEVSEAGRRCPIAKADVGDRESGRYVAGRRAVTRQGAGLRPAPTRGRVRFVAWRYGLTPLG